MLSSNDEAALWLASLLLSSFPTEEDEDEVVLLADDCLRLRLTSSDLLSLDTEPEVVCEAKADCAVEDWFDKEGADGQADEDLRPLEAVVFSSLVVSSVGRCCWLGTPLSWCIKDLASHRWGRFFGLRSWLRFTEVRRNEQPNSWHQL